MTVLTKLFAQSPAPRGQAALGRYNDRMLADMGLSPAEPATARAAWCLAPVTRQAL